VAAVATRAADCARVGIKELARLRLLFKGFSACGASKSRGFTRPVSDSVRSLAWTRGRGRT